MNFDDFDFDPWIRDGIDEAGYGDPTPIQAGAIPHVLAGRDVLGLAQTGTGKTAAFLLPIMQRLLDGEIGKPRALIVAPTRELADQIEVAFKQLGCFTDLRSVCVYGGVGKAPQIDALRKGVEIVVACPGRLLDHWQNHDIDLSKVEVLVLDEADHMFDMGFLPDIRRILDILPSKRQNLFFSATMPSHIKHLADSVLVDPITVSVAADAPAETVSHALYPVTEGLRKQLMMAMLKSHAQGRVLIFTRTKHRASGLASALKKQGYNVADLQGNMAQGKRKQAIDGFRNGKYEILVATDIAARGIDITNVTHVINYDMPGTVDAYTHRIGRTGRALRSGTAYTLATQADEPLVHRVERVLKTPIERRTLEGFDYGTFQPENQGYRLGEKKPEHSRSDSRGGMSASARRRPAPRRGRISKR